VIKKSETILTSDNELLEKSLSNKPLSLIVDDEDDICFLLDQILKSRDVDSFCVNNLADAEVFLQTHDPALIFLDNKLPDGFGVDHIHSFKAKHPSAKIIMITAHDNYNAKALSAGADYFISKPFSKNTILEAVHQLDI
jgi:DNA-binding response OmpR family regulator